MSVTRIVVHRELQKSRRIQRKLRGKKARKGTSAGNQKIM